MLKGKLSGLVPRLNSTQTEANDATDYSEADATNNYSEADGTNNYSDTIDTNDYSDESDASVSDVSSVIWKCLAIVQNTKLRLT